MKMTILERISHDTMEVHYAEEITWGILPYVPMQYEDRRIRDAEK